MKVLVFSLGLVAILCFFTFSNTEIFAQSSGVPNANVLSTKGVVAEGSQFSGQVVWTLVNKDSGAIVHSSSNGIVVVRLALEKSAECIDSPNAICIDATVSQLRNTASHNVGDKLKLIFDGPEKETISIISGPLENTQIDVNLEKMRMKEAEPKPAGQNFTIKLTDGMRFSTGG